MKPDLRVAKLFGRRFVVGLGLCCSLSVPAFALPAGGSISLFGWGPLNPVYAGSPPMWYGGILAIPNWGILGMIPAIADTVWGQGTSSAAMLAELSAYYHTTNPAETEAVVSAYFSQKALPPPVSLAFKSWESAHTRLVADGILPGKNTSADKGFAEKQTQQGELTGGANNLPSGACDEAYRAGVLGSSVLNTTAQEQTALSSQLTYNAASVPLTGAALSGSLMQAPANYSAEAIFGPDDLGQGSVIPATNLAENYITNSTLPIPFPPIPEAVMSSPNGGKVLGLRDQDIAGIGLSQSALSDIVAERAATATDSTWAPGLTGLLSLLPAGVVSPSPVPAGGTSLMRVLATAVSARFANPAYLEGIMSEPSVKVAAQMELTNTVSDELKYLIIETRQRKLALESAVLARLASVKGSAGVMLK